jgi:hypothetical protein
MYPDNRWAVTPQWRAAPPQFDGELNKEEWQSAGKAKAKARISVRYYLIPGVARNSACLYSTTRFAKGKPRSSIRAENDGQTRMALR